MLSSALARNAAHTFVPVALAAKAMEVVDLQPDHLGECLEKSINIRVQTVLLHKLFDVLALGVVDVRVHLLKACST